MSEPLTAEAHTDRRRDRPQLVHICGFPSSGTDLLSNFMSAHPDIDVRGEFPLIAKLAKKYDATVPPEEVSNVIRMLQAGDVYNNLANPSPALEEIAQSGDRVAMADIYSAMLTNRKVRWCGNKTPQNTENMEQLMKLFPQTRFVFITRDVRDVCVSWRRKWGKDMLLCAAKWNARMKRGLQVMDEMPSDRVLRLRFEDFIAEPGLIGQKISRFLDVHYDTNFLDYYNHVRTRPDGKKNYGKPIEAANQGKWRHELTELEVRRIEEIAMPMMTKLDYSPEIAECHGEITPFELVRGAATDIYAVLVIGNRYRRRNRLRDRLRKMGISIRYRMPYA